MSSDNPNRPAWVTTIDGVPEAFKPLEKEEAEKLALAAIEEARQFSSGQGMQFATPDQKFLMDAERRREHHKRNAELFTETGDKEQETLHRQWWAEAAIDVGLLDEARKALLGKKGIVDKEKNEFIKRLKKAIQRPDDAQCRCKREEVEDDGGKVIELDRRYAVRKIFSSVHNQIVTLYKCRHCPFMNATAQVPTRQTDYEMNRKAIELQTRAALSKGTIPSKGASDAQVLKVN